MMHAEIDHPREVLVAGRRCAPAVAELGDEGHAERRGDGDRDHQVARHDLSSFSTQRNRGRDGRARTAAPGGRPPRFTCCHRGVRGGGDNRFTRPAAGRLDPLPLSETSRSDMVRSPRFIESCANSLAASINLFAFSGGCVCALLCNKSANAHCWLASNIAESPALVTPSSKRSGLRPSGISRARNP